jgi:NAD(P)-dependent dehydrogenase (short-subunit alcohol dehydrogenase family)
MKDLAWVIGGTSGIGLETAVRLGEKMPTLVSGIEVNVSDRKRLFDYYCDHGPFSNIVYSAGVNVLGWIGQLNPVDVQRQIQTNLVGFVNIIDAVASHHDQPTCRITAVSSDASERPMRTSIVYCASKAGLNMAVRCAAREMGPKGWVVNGVAPGMTEQTAMQDYIDREVPRIRGWTPEHARAYENKQNPMERRATVEEIADAIVFMQTGPRYTNGSILTVNGGR